LNATKLNEVKSGIELFTGAGTLLAKDQQFKLNDFYGVWNQQWKLLYKATRDGFSASIFHRTCDNKGPTMTIIKSSEGWIFGGFTTQSWSGTIYKTDPQAFLFTFTNPHNIPATKFIVRSDRQNNAICAFPGKGPTFGGAHDIYVSSNSNTDNNRFTGSHIGFPTTYQDTTGIARGMLFTGSESFTTTDIEVYAIM